MFAFLGNFLQTLATPKIAEPRSLTACVIADLDSAKVVIDGRYVTFKNGRVRGGTAKFQEILH